jgi:hypothetical protein
MQMTLDRMMHGEPLLSTMGGGDATSADGEGGEEGAASGALDGGDQESALASSISSAGAGAAADDEDLRSVATHTSHVSDMSRPLEPTMLNAQHPTTGMLGQ